MKKNNATKTILGFVTGGVAFCLLFVMWVYPEVKYGIFFLAALLAGLLGVLLWMSQKELKEAAQRRSVRYGANAAMTTSLVVAILVVLSYLNFSHFARKDLTKNKRYSLSDQTVKIVKDLQQDIKLTVYTKTGDRDAIRPLLDNYRYQNPSKVSIEYVDPDREPVRTKAANVKKYGTVVVQAGKRESRVEDATEEKLTNAFLKVLKDQAITVCFLTGHGEHDQTLNSAEGYSRVVLDLASQNYESKSLNLMTEAKVPSYCTVVAILGPTKSFFDKEISALREWLDNGGRALVALDPNLTTDTPYAKEIKELLSEWWVEVPNNLVIDPASKVANMSASVPLIGIYSKESPITREFTAAQTSLFPLTSTVDFKQGAPTTINTFWLAKSTPYAFAKSHFVKELATGKVSKDPNKDTQGPLIVMAAVAGSRMGAKKPPEKATRIVVMGSSQVGTNKWINFGGNSDLVLNAVSWLAGDESLISIRPKDEGEVRASLSEVELSYSKFLTRLLIPGSTMIAGLLVWRRRKKL